MPLPLPAPRHTIEKSGSSVQVTLPRKRTVLSIIWATLGILGWGYLVNLIIFLMEMFSRFYELMKSILPETSSNDVLVGILYVLFYLLLFLLVMGPIAINYRLSNIFGKEIFEADSEMLKVTRQIFRWKRTREYAAEEVKDLRVYDKQIWWFGSKRNFQKLRAYNGLIAFDYGAKTIRFGSEIDEAEAKQIILALKEGFNQQNVG